MVDALADKAAAAAAADADAEAAAAAVVAHALAESDSNRFREAHTMIFRVRDWLMAISLCIASADILHAALYEANDST